MIILLNLWNWCTSDVQLIALKVLNVTRYDIVIWQWCKLGRSVYIYFRRQYASLCYHFMNLVNENVRKRTREFREISNWTRRCAGQVYAKFIYSGVYCVITICCAEHLEAYELLLVNSTDRRVWFCETLMNESIVMYTSGPFSWQNSFAVEIMS